MQIFTIAYRSDCIYLYIINCEKERFFIKEVKKGSGKRKNARDEFVRQLIEQKW